MACTCTPDGATIGDFELVWPSDVDDFVRRLDVDFQTTDRSVKTCQGLPVATSTAWSSFLDSWKKFRDEGTGVFGAGGRMDNARRYQRDLSNWQALLNSARCDLAAPRLADEPGSAIPWIAALVVTGAVVYLAGPAIRATLTRLTR